MIPERIEIEPHDPPDARRVAQVVEVLHRGGVVAYPTDTVYALGCALEAKRAAERIYRARKMAVQHRLAMLLPDLSAAAEYAHFSRLAYRLAKRLLPGPYTLILPATREVPRQLWEHKRRRVVGIRISAHPITRAIVEGLGRPLLTTSAIPDGEEQACEDADELIDAFGHHVNVVVNSGPLINEPSTIIEIVDDAIEVVRVGAGPVNDILAD